MNIEQLEIAKLCVIVPFGQGSRVAHIASQHGIHGGTILLGKGTFYNKFMELLGLNETRKEIVWLLAQKAVAEEVLQVLEKELKLNQRNTGIAYIEPLVEVVGVKRTKYINNKIEENTMLQAIYTVVDRGLGHAVVEAASLAGASGGTIIEGRGAGEHQVQKVFAIEIEPEKDIVLTIASTDHVDAIVDSIRNKLDIELEGKGIIFVHPVSKSIGINRV